MVITDFAVDSVTVIPMVVNIIKKNKTVIKAKVMCMQKKN
jgi:hypothetical protein